MMKIKNAKRSGVRGEILFDMTFFLAFTLQMAAAPALRQYINTMPLTKEVDRASAPQPSMVVSQPRYFYCVLYPWSLVINPVYCMRQYRNYGIYLRARNPSTVKPDDGLGYDPGLIDPRAADHSVSLSAIPTSKQNYSAVSL